MGSNGGLMVKNGGLMVVKNGDLIVIKHFGTKQLWSGWWLTYPSEKYEKSVGIMTFPIFGKIKAMFQTTNQLWFV